MIAVLEIYNSKCQTKEDLNEIFKLTARQSGKSSANLISSARSLMYSGQWKTAISAYINL